jgi:hypothetical protein
MSTSEQIQSEAVPTDGRPPWDDGKWQGTAWLVTLTYQGRTYETPFYMGSGLNGKAPETMEVVECLMGDACSADNAADVWDFFDELGYTPSRDANATYEACVQTAVAMHMFLGDDFDRFAYPDYEQEA